MVNKPKKKTTVRPKLLNKWAHSIGKDEVYAYIKEEVLKKKRKEIEAPPNYYEKGLIVNRPYEDVPTPTPRRVILPELLKKPRVALPRPTKKSEDLKNEKKRKKKDVPKK